MPNNKKHHYVPRFYLKRFSDNGKSIGLYNLGKKLRIPVANLKNQCYKDYFYGKGQVTENALGEIEGHISVLFSVIDELGDLSSLGSIPRTNLIYYILIQYTRTHFFADAMDELNDKIIKHVFGKEFESEIDGINLDDFIIGIQDVSQYALYLAVQTYPLLLDLRAKLIINRTSEEFITSDNPVVMYNPFMLFRKIGGNTGYAAKGLQVFLPMDPEKVIILYDDKVYRMGNENKNTIEVYDKRDIYNINALQACSCYENIYFRNDNINTVALHRKVKHHLRSVKARIEVFPQEDSPYKRSEMILSFREGINMSIKLSFMSTRKTAIKWHSAFKKLKIQPVVVVRNQKLVNVWRDFQESVKKGEYSAGNFFQFFKEKYIES